jgi:hypothetical protein
MNADNSGARIDFQWRLSILDDRPDDITEVPDILRGVGYDVTVIATLKDFCDAEKLAHLADSDIVMVDMEWTGFGQESDPLFLPSSPVDSSIETLVEFATKWATAVSAWAQKSITWSVLEGWPRRPIEERSIGLWLAALASHVAPDCEIILYSGQAEIAGGGDLAALGQFRRSQYSVITKSSVGTIAPEILLPALELLQKRRLSVDIDLRRWFFGSVLLPLLLNSDLANGEITVLNRFNGRPFDVTLRPGLVFPQLRGRSDSDRIKSLTPLLPGVSMTKWQRVALHTLLHNLYPTNIAGLDEEDLVASCNEFLASCPAAGTIGVHFSGGLLRAREAARVGDAVEAKSALLMTWRDMFAFTRSARYLIADLCTTHGGKYNLKREGHEVLVRGWPSGGAREIKGRTADRHVRVAPDLLRGIVSALRTNASDERNGSSKVGNLNALEDEASMTLVWRDRTNGFATIADFRRAVASSLEAKGRDRGLPGALEAAIELGADAIGVLIRGQWIEVFGPEAPTEYLETLDSASAPEPFAFGFYLRLPTEPGDRL